ncbi:MAG TPA: malectin domain-containing carbohydrate-binding protein, partial [bacterium]|nr:malectin domain-containing carbohydrate-binding protein [bacterium]
VIQNLAIDSTGQFLMMGTDVGGIFRSLNGGSSWQPADVGYGPRGGCAFAIDPNNSSRVLAVGCNSGAQSWNGLWLSTNQAASWTPVLQQNMQGSGTYHDSVAFDASSKTVSGGVTYSSVAYWVAYSDGGGGLWKSTNGGQSWSKIQSSYADGIVKVNPSNGTVYVATANGFYYSTNGGSSFTQVVSGAVLGLEVISTQPSNVYINETNGVYVSTNSGQSFSKMGSSGLPTGDSPGLRNLKVSPANPQNMLIDDDQGSYTSQNYYYSNNGGSSWSTCSLGSTQSFIPTNTREWLFAWSPVNANQAWACGGDYLSQTTNAGANFNWSANGYNDFTCTGYFNFNPQNPNLLLVTSQDYNSAFTASVTNTTATWQYLAVSGQGWGGFTYGGYALSPTVLVAGNAPGWGSPATLMVSTNGGSNWSNTGLVGNNTQAACGDPNNSSVAFFDNFRTANNGGSWSAMTNCDGVFTYNANPSGSHELYGAKGSTVVKSTNDGQTWTNVVTVSNTVMDVACDWKNNQLYIATGDLYTCSLTGSNLQTIDSRLASDNQGNQGADSVAVDPVDPNVAYVAWTGNSYMSSQAVRRTLNGGQTWSPLTLQPGDTGLDGGRESQCVRVNPATRYLYSTGSCFGVWKYPAPSSGTPTSTPTVTWTGTASFTRTITSTPTITLTPTITSTPTRTFTPTATPTATSIYVNCAGPQYISASAGITWLADQAYTTGGWGYLSGSAFTSPGPISGTQDPTLYESERSDTGVTYVFNLANHAYNVTLKYAETYNTAAGQRVFNVALNGSLVLTGLDLYSVTGGKNIAYDRSFPVTVTNGTLEIDETATVQTATLMGIAIVPAGPTTPTPTPTRTNSSTATATSTPSSTPSGTPTPTLSSTPTWTGTATGTPSNSPTGTPTATFTSTSTATSTGTSTNSFTATGTATSSFTPVPSSTSSNTSTTTGTSTPSSTPTNSPTGTPSSTSTPTSTATSTGTSTNSFTATGTATATLTPTITFTPIPASTGASLYVNCAGPQYVSSSSGITWNADQAYTSGGWGYRSGTAYTSTGPISNTQDQSLYESERAASGVTYTFTLPNQVYNVTLKYAETYNTAAGQRVFNVVLNGATVLANLDLYAATGGKNIAYDRTFPVTVTNGTLELDETASIQSATLQSVAIVVVGPAPPIATPTPTLTPTVTFTPTITPTATSLYVNCAGPQYVSASGVTWSADQAYSTGGWGYRSGTAYTSAGPISNTQDQGLYESERAASGVTYTFTLPNQVYNVTLKYAETYNTAAGKRVFNVVLNGATVLSNLDLYAVTGGKNIAYDRTFPITVTNGTLELDETATIQSATLQAIAITPYGVPAPAVMRPVAGISQNNPTPVGAATSSSTPTPKVPASPTATPTPTWPYGNNLLANPLPFPNPASGVSIHVRLSSQIAGNGQLTIFTVGGMKVAEMDLGEIQPGDTTVILPLADKTGVSLANGLYYLVFRLSNHQSVGKLLVLQ